MIPVIVSRATLGAERWDEFVDAHPGGWFWHTSRWLDYSLAYAPTAADRSFAVINEEGAVLGLVPLIHADRLVAGGQEPPAAIFSQDGLSQATELAWRNAVALVGTEVNRCTLRPGVAAPPGMPPGARRINESTFVVDLRKDEKTLWREIRKSYKSLINAADRKYDISVHREAWAVNAAEQLHLAVVGRRTRAVATWEMMGAWAQDGYGLTALIRTGKDAYGFAYAIRYKTWAYFASGATTTPSVAHALQWALIKALRADGATRYYEIGHDASEDASDKDRGIATFKSGFGGVRVSIVRTEPEMITPRREMRRI